MLLAISIFSLIYVVRVINQMTEYLGIHCFTIVPKEIGRDESDPSPRDSHSH